MSEFLIWDKSIKRKIPTDVEKSENTHMPEDVGISVNMQIPYDKDSIQIPKDVETSENTQSLEDMKLQTAIRSRGSAVALFGVRTQYLLMYGQPCGSVWRTHTILAHVWAALRLCLAYSHNTCSCIGSPAALAYTHNTCSCMGALWLCLAYAHNTCSCTGSAVALFGVRTQYLLMYLFLQAIFHHQSYFFKKTVQVLLNFGGFFFGGGEGGSEGGGVSWIHEFPRNSAVLLKYREICSKLQRALKWLSTHLESDRHTGRPPLCMVESYQWHKISSWWLPCLVPGVIGSVLGMVGLVSAYCDWGVGGGKFHWQLPSQCSRMYNFYLSVAECTTSISV